MPLLGSSLNCASLGLWNSIKPLGKGKMLFSPGKNLKDTSVLSEKLGGWHLLRGATQTPWTRGQEMTRQLWVPGTLAPTLMRAAWHMRYLSQQEEAYGSFGMSRVLAGGKWWGFPGDSVVKKSTCQCKRGRFNPWSRKTSQGAEQLSPCTAAIEPVLQSPRAATADPTRPRADA